MIKDKKILAIIPARGGSKGLKNKNLSLLQGIPLLAWTILTAKKSRYIDKMILSSEDNDIIAMAKHYDLEVPFTRPAELSEDDTPGILPILHAIDQVSGYDYVLVLQVTSPLRSADDIDNCLEQCITEGHNALVSVTQAAENPYWMYYVNDEHDLYPLFPGENYACRQQLPEVYNLNGAIYLAHIPWLRQQKTFMTDKTKAYIMPQENSLDIDDEVDLYLAEIMLKKLL